MDELVAAALVKWPNVPHCHGWLGLDARGNWYLRDERVQIISSTAPCYMYPRYISITATGT